MSTGPTLYLGLGSNSGRRLAHLRNALRSLDDTPGFSLRSVSSVYESEAHTRPGETLGDFLNLVAGFDTTLKPEEILDACLAIETRAGRRRSSETWLPRTIDIDILIVADLVLNSERLKVPHPRMAERLFVLLPFAELEPERWIPAPYRATVADLLKACPDRLAVERRYPAGAVFDRGDMRS